MNRVYLVPECGIKTPMFKDFIGYRFTKNGSELRGDVHRWAVDAKGFCIIVITQGVDVDAMFSFLEKVKNSLRKKDADGISEDNFRPTNFYYTGE